MFFLTGFIFTALIGVVCIVLGDNYIQIVKLGSLIQPLKKSGLKEIVGIKKNNVLSSGALKAVVSCKSGACIGFGDDTDSRILLKIQVAKPQILEGHCTLLLLQ